MKTEIQSSYKKPIRTLYTLFRASNMTRSSQKAFPATIAFHLLPSTPSYSPDDLSHLQYQVRIHRKQ